MKTILALLTVLVAAGCAHPLPTPQVLLSCAIDAAKDPKFRDALLNALAQPNFEAAVFAILSPALGWTEAAAICVIDSMLGRLGADPARTVQYEHARAYLTARGVVL
jgi:hypothetical protein